MIIYIFIEEISDAMMKEKKEYIYRKQEVFNFYKVNKEIN